MEEKGKPRLSSGIWERALERDDKLAHHLIRQAVDALGVGIASSLNLLDVEAVVIGGGLDYYPGSATATPSFNFRATHLRLAGDGDLLARLQALREELRRDGLFDPQKQLARPLLPKTIGVVTARGSAACQDLLAGLERRGWRGTIVWADAPR